MLVGSSLIFLLFFFSSFLLFFFSSFLRVQLNSLDSNTFAFHFSEGGLVQALRHDHLPHAGSEASSIPPGRFAPRRMGVVHGSSTFDASFFNLTAGDALCMDPQQRILLECVVEALNRAGIPFQSLRGTNTGVWVGCSIME